MGGFVVQPGNLVQAINLDNEMGTSNKPPKLLRMEDYPGWADRFETYVQAMNYDTWLAVEEEYVIGKNENGTNYRLSQVNEADKPRYLREKKMLNILQQAIKE